MSDVSVLSNQYETLIETSDKINDSIIALKKQFLFAQKDDPKYKSLETHPDEITKATSYLKHFLSGLEELLKNKNEVPEDIPNVIASDYVKNLEFNFPGVKADVQNILANLNAEKLLNFEQLIALDKILAILDGERKVLFRKLRSSRA